MDRGVLMTEDDWIKALEERHLADLTISEVTRALRALSSCYVERRDRLATGAALAGAGKRAAFALFYSPQHFLIAREVWRHLTPATPVSRILDLGCGTGSSGAALAVESGASIQGFDLNKWAITEASWTYRLFGLAGQARVLDIKRVRLDGRPGDLVLAAYAVNELAPGTRDELLARLMAAHRCGAALLVIEPIGRRTNPWWTDWARTFQVAGGREDDWRFRTPLPPLPRALAKGAGLNVQELTARSLYLPFAPEPHRS